MLSSIQSKVDAESSTYKDLITDAQLQINIRKNEIKNLEELCAAYQTIIDNNTVNVAQASRDVAEVINTLICKREF